MPLHTGLYYLIQGIRQNSEGEQGKATCGQETRQDEIKWLPLATFVGSHYRLIT